MSCVICKMHLYPTDDVRNGPCWPSAASNVGYELYEGGKAPEVAKDIDAKISNTYVGLDLSDPEKPELTHDVDTDSESEASEDETLTKTTKAFS